MEAATVTLGLPIGDKAALGEVIADTVVRLRNAGFGGAEAIVLHLGAGDTLRAMTYEYGTEADFPARVAEYESLLGPPARRFQQGTAGADLTDVIVWEDPQTHFELQWVTRPAGAVSRALLIDRRLSGL